MRPNHTRYPQFRGRKATEGLVHLKWYDYWIPTRSLNPVHMWLVVSNHSICSVTFSIRTLIMWMGLDNWVTWPSATTPNQVASIGIGEYVSIVPTAQKILIMCSNVSAINAVFTCTNRNSTFIAWINKPTWKRHSREKLTASIALRIDITAQRWMNRV